MRKNLQSSWKVGSLADGQQTNPVTAAGRESESLKMRWPERNRLAGVARRSEADLKFPDFLARNLLEPGNAGALKCAPKTPFEAGGGQFFLTDRLAPLRSLKIWLNAKSISISLESKPGRNKLYHLQ